VPMFLNPGGEVEGFRNGHDARNLGQTPSALNPNFGLAILPKLS